LDRDDTLNRDRVGGYIDDCRDIVPMPFAREFIENAKGRGYLLFLITNQSGVGHGFFPLEAVHRCNRRLVELLGGGEIFTEIGISIGTARLPDAYRKPSPHFAVEMCRRHGLDLRRCWMVGNGPMDMGMAANAGMRGILVNGAAVQLTAREARGCFARCGDLRAAWRILRKANG
jgi:histidinol-phosphate phosphatase family protein